MAQGWGEQFAFSGSSKCRTHTIFMKRSFFETTVCCHWEVMASRGPDTLALRRSCVRKEVANPCPFWRAGGAWRCILWWEEVLWSAPSYLQWRKMFWEIKRISIKVKKKATYCKNLVGGEEDKGIASEPVCYLRSEAQKPSLRPGPTRHHHGGSSFHFRCFHMALYHAAIFLFFHISLSF